MKASFGAKVLRTAILTAIFAGLFWIQLGTPDPASARTRPPIEMGDPDGTGDQAPKGGLGAGAGATKTTARVAPQEVPLAHEQGFITGVYERHYVRLLQLLLSRP
jgi:hypothetical protein